MYLLFRNFPHCWYCVPVQFSIFHRTDNLYISEMSTELIHCLHNSMSMIGRLMQLWALAPAPGIYNLLTIIYKHTCRVDPMYTLYCIFISIISLLFIYLLLVSGSFCVFLGFSWIFNGIHLLNIQKYFVQLMKNLRNIPFER